MIPSEADAVQGGRLVTGLALVLGGITVVMTLLGVIYNPIVLVVALTFGLATYFVYYHASGRLAARVYRRVERRAAANAGPAGASRRREGAGFGAGPRDEWRPPRDGASARAAASGGSGNGPRSRGRRRENRRRSRPTSGPSTAEAYRTLGLDPGADEAAVKRAYRERVKEVHPDADGGDEEEFKAVTAAYDRLTD